MPHHLYFTHPSWFRRLLPVLLLSCRALAGAGQQVVPPASAQQLVVDLTTPGKPGSLAIKLLNGSIHVKGYSGKSILIEVVEQPHLTSDEPTAKAIPPGMKRLSPVNSLAVTAEERDNHVEVRTNSYRHPMELTIRVPMNFSLKLGTVNRGNIIVENVRGELEVSSMNGAVSLTQVSGSAVATTINGALTASFTGVTTGAPMAFSSLSGKIDVTLPSSTKAALKLRSDRGQVYSDFEVSLDNKTPQVTRTQQNGLSRLSTDTWIYGTLNGGGAEIMLKSMNGSIFLRKAN